MNEERFCDICGKFESELPALENKPKLTIDEDGLWICAGCEPKLATDPVGDGWDVELEDELKALIGKSAGAICRTLDLPYAPPYHIVLDAASKIGYDADHYMSGWLFVNQWLDGSTVWRAEDGRGMAIVKPNGEVQVNSDWFAD
ncbi:MAG: hypothetical protein Kow002_02330 [Anaerolineales bacterium]